MRVVALTVLVFSGIAWLTSFPAASAIPCSTLEGYPDCPLSDTAPRALYQRTVFDHSLRTIPASIQHIRAGKLRPLGVTTATRLDVLPGVPAVAETVPGYETSAWQGVGAPKGTPADIVDLLNKQINAGLADDTIKQRLLDLGAVPIPMSSAQFADMIAAETDKFAKVIKFANIKAE